MDFVIMMPLGPQLMRHLEIGPQRFGWLVSAYTFAASLSGLISSFFIDRFDRKRALLFLYGGFSFGTLMCALAPNYWLLMAARITAGVFGGILGGVTFSIIGDSFEESVRGTATGMVMSAFSIASIIGIPTGLWLANRFSWHAPFFLLAATSTLVLALAAFSMPSIRAHLQSGSLNLKATLLRLKAVVTHPNHLRAYSMTIVMMFGGFTVIPFISPYLVANVGIREVDLATVYFFSGITTLIMSNVIGRLSDRYGKYPVFRVVAIASAVPILVLTHLPPVPLVIAIVTVACFSVSMSGRFVPLMAMITSSVDPRLRGSFMSIHSCIQQFGSGLASLTAGFIVSKSSGGQLAHYHWVGFLATGATLACVFIARHVQAFKDEGSVFPSVHANRDIAHDVL